MNLKALGSLCPTLIPLPARKTNARVAGGGGGANLAAVAYVTICIMHAPRLAVTRCGESKGPGLQGRRARVTARPRTLQFGPKSEPCVPNGISKLQTPQSYQLLSPQAGWTTASVSRASFPRAIRLRSERAYRYNERVSTSRMKREKREKK